MGSRPCDNPVDAGVISANMSLKLFVRYVYLSDGTRSTQVCMRASVQQVIEQCLVYTDQESDVLHDTMACGSEGFYIYFKSKLVLPSSTALSLLYDMLPTTSASTPINQTLHGIYTDNI